MKKIYMVMLAAILFSVSSVAQKGKNYIGGGAGLSLPTGDFGTFFKTGIDIYGKGLFGIGSEGQITITGGYSNFKAKGSDLDNKMVTTAAPLLLGYRHNFYGGLFVEPQIGYGIYGLKVMNVDEDWTDSDGMFTWAAGVGYVFNKTVEISARYQSASKHGTGIEMVGIRVGYNFSLGGSK